MVTGSARKTAKPSAARTSERTMASLGPSDHRLAGRKSNFEFKVRFSCGEGFGAALVPLDHMREGPRGSSWTPNGRRALASRRPRRAPASVLSARALTLGMPYLTPKAGTSCGRPCDHQPATTSARKCVPDLRGPPSRAADSSSSASPSSVLCLSRRTASRN
jgi:hypothetical protein